MDDIDILEQRTHFEVVETLMEFPFNVSQIGFNMLVSCIKKVLKIDIPDVSYTKTIFKEVSEEFNVTIQQLEKYMRDTLVTLNVNCLNDPSIEYPNYLIKATLSETKVKNFISTMALYIKAKRNRNVLASYNKNCWL